MENLQNETVSRKREYNRQYWLANKERLRAQNKPIKKAWYEKNKAKVTAQSRQWRIDNREQMLMASRNRHLREKYGIEHEEFERLCREQNGLCAICKCDLSVKRGNGRPHIDHDHKTGQVRAILCHPCNVGIGQFGDDIHRLLQAVEYLTKHMVKQ